jgi:cell division protein FtsL
MFSCFLKIIEGRKMEQIFKYSMILTIALPMFLMAAVAIFSAIVVITDTSTRDR